MVNTFFLSAATLVRIALEQLILVLSLLTFRGLPTIVTLMIARDISSRARICCLASYLLAAALSLHLAEFDPLSIVSAYGLSAAGSLVYFLLAIRLRPNSSFVLISACIGLTLIGPLTVSNGELLLVSICWESSFAAYSYCVTFSRAPAAARWYDYLFFVYVNPVFAHTSKAKAIGRPALRVRFLCRCLRGVLLIACAGTISKIARIYYPHYEWFILSTNLASICWAHYGLASVQIGLFAQLGWLAPERYLQPFSAVSPADFWRRWNAHMNAWGLHHVYLPLFRRCRSRFGLSRPVSHCVSVVVVFGVVGFAHDAYLMLVNSHLQATLTIWFLANALLVLSWSGFASIFGLMKNSTRLTTIIQHVAMAACIVLMFFFFPRT